MSTSIQAEPELLTAGALNALDIRKQPFSTDAEHHTPFLNNAFQDVLDQTQLLLQTSSQLPIIVGPSGAGKSSLLSLLISKATDSVQYFIIEGNQQFSAYNVFAGMLEAFQHPAPEDFQDCLDELAQELLTLENQSFKAIILLDDAHEVPATELYKLISGMLYMRKDSELHSFRIALTATPDFESYVAGAIPTDSGMSYSTLQLPRLTAPDTSEFLEHHLKHAGFYESLPVNNKQLDIISRNSDGLPGSISKEAVLLINELFQSSPKSGDRTQSVRKLMNNSLTSINKNYALGGIAIALIGISTFMFTGSDEQESSTTQANPVDKKSNTVIISEPLQMVPNEKSGPPKLVLLSELNSHSTSNKHRVTQPTPPPSPVTTPIAKSKVIAPVAELIKEVASEPPTGKLNENIKKVEKIESEPKVVVTPAIEKPVILAEPELAKTEEPTPIREEPATSVASTTTLSTELEQLLETPNWVLLQPPTQFTVQMIASSKRSEVERFIIRHKLDGPNSIFAFNRGDETWYALIHGLYAEIDDAKDAVKSLPKAVRSQHPWIRQIKRIHQSLKK